MKPRIGLLVVIAMLGAMLLFGCTASSQEKAVNASFLTYQAAEVAFTSFDKQEETTIGHTCGAGLTDNASYLAACAKAHADYEAQRLDYDKAMATWNAALVAAYKLTNDKTLAGVVAAATQVAAILKTLGVNL